MPSKVHAHTHVLPRLDWMAVKYLQGPQSVGEKSSHLQIPEVGLWLGSGALPLDRQGRIEAGLSLVDLRQLDQTGRGIWVPFERGYEF